MPEDSHPPTRTEPRRAPESDDDAITDSLRQIDRWVNEGGAEERTTGPDPRVSESREWQQSGG